MDDADYREKEHLVYEYEPFNEIIDEYQGVNVYKKFNNIDLYEQESEVF